MDNILLKYFEDRFNKQALVDPVERKRYPVITISREFGCPARDVSSSLFEALQVLPTQREHPWRLISKEILKEAAKELNMHPSKLKYVFTAEQRSVLDNVVDAIATRNYKSERTIRNTISDVVNDMARKCNLIILGMGGASILYGHPNVINLKLIGPFEWRAANISRWQSISIDKARAKTIEMDETRRKVLLSFLPSKLKEPHFDIIVNCLNITNSEIVEIITNLVCQRASC